MQAYPYKVDYNDHFETPLAAYKDIQPILEEFRKDLGESKSTIKLYDPFYCNGRTSRLLGDELGYGSVIHEKCDFYVDMERNRVPQHQLLITNPPYSADHKERVFNFACAHNENRPFLLLLPSYVATKEYFKKILSDFSSQYDFIYVVPKTAYEYDHPEGTGHTVPPFFSIWYCGVPIKAKTCDSGSNLTSRLLACYSSIDLRISVRATGSLLELDAWKVIKLDKRLNPRQRRKRRLAKGCGSKDSNSEYKRDIHNVEWKKKPNQIKSVLPHQNRESRSSFKAKKNSKKKHRDENGVRKRKRF